MMARSIEIARKRGIGELSRAARSYLVWHPILDELQWNLYRLAARRSTILKTVNGCRMLLNVSNGRVHKHLFLHGRHEPECTRILMETLPRDARVLDIGAHIGYYALLEAQLSQRVYAIEPGPENSELLRRNIELNSLEDRIEVHHVAMSDKVGTDTFYMSKETEKHRLRSIPASRNYRTLEVATLTVDEFLKHREVDFIRMDVQGAEWLVIAGMTSILKANQPLTLFVEVHPLLIKDYGGDAVSLVKVLLDSGFRLMYLVGYSPLALFSLQTCFRSRGQPPELPLAFQASDNDPLSDKNVMEIVGGSSVFKVFMDRQGVEAETVGPCAS